MRRALILTCVILMLLTVGVRAELSASVDQKVKSATLYSMICEDGHSWAHTWFITNVEFIPQSVPAQISPLSNDPGVVTSNPFLLSTCPLETDDDGQLEATFTADFKSLKDLGVWKVTFFGTWLDDAFCSEVNNPPGECDFDCTQYEISDWSEPFTFIITVFNDPPAASISHSPTPAWNQAVTFDASASDPDGGPLVFRWSITQRPPGSTTNLTGAETATPSLPFSSDKDIGDWTIKLDLDDDEGERRTFTHNLTVPNVPPNISVSGATSIDVLDTINLQVTPTTDVDGGNLDITWDILQSPPGASEAPQSSFATGPTLTLPTTEADIGTWKFKATAEDNENATDSVETTVEVKNIPPEINLVGETEIDVGQTISVETTVLDDEDGGLLDFKWDIIQAPQSSGITVQESFVAGAGAAGSLIEIPAGFNEAGTWVLRLTATDNDDSPNSEVSEDFTVVVDAPPEAIITGPDVIGSLSFPLQLSAETSVDPDSPCPAQPDRCHDTLDPPVKSISPGIVSYTWSLIDVPFELWDKYPLGAIDEVFGKPAHSPTMSLSLGDIEPGEWAFQLEIKDGEGNEDSAVFNVTVVDENGPPIAIVSEPGRYTVDTIGQLTQDIALTGGLSFDLDNLLSGGAEGPGVGITNYQWDIIEAPPGCTPPALPSGPAQTTVTLFTAGTMISPTCQGFWRIRLTVTDDEDPSKTGIAETIVIIGNCPQPICIDYPKTLAPQVVAFAEDTDIIVFYHVDSALYDEPAFLAGMFCVLEIFHESDPSTPVFTSVDPNVLATDKGGSLLFHWNGYTDSNERPKPGLYTVRITPVDASLGVTGISATELNAIWISVADPDILPTSETYQDFNQLAAGTDQLTINYEIEGGASPDELLWRVKDDASIVVFESNAPPTTAGTINWDGQINGSTIPTGFYTVELEAFRDGASLGLSSPHSFVIYKLALVPSVGVASGSPPGTYVFVNIDDDNSNNVSDLTESAAGENDLMQVSLTIEPPLEGVVSLSGAGPTPPFKLWDTGAKGAEKNLPATFNTPADTVPPQLFIEGQSAAPSSLSLQVTTSDGVTLGPVQMALTMVEVKVMEDTNNDFIIGAGDAQKHFVRPGLWDFAFRTAADAFGAAGTLYNEEDEARIGASGNPENFVGRDSRRFYYQISDPSANTNPAVQEQISVANFEWFTIKADGTNDDHPPTNRSIHLIETGNNTGIFSSRALMIVSDQIDRDQGTNTGITAQAGTALFDQINHRSRQVQSPDGMAVAQYRPAGAGGPQFELRTPLFNRNPEERRVMQVRVFNFSDTLNLGIPAIPIATINSLTDVLKERYAAVGIRVVVTHNVATDTIDLPAGSTVNLAACNGFTGSFGTLAPSADQSSLINLVRAVDPATQANADTIYLLFVGNFVSGSRGQSFPDGWIPAGSPARNFIFVAGSATQIDYTAAHEVGHMVLNETLTAGEANGTTAGWAPGGHYGGSQDTFNLMRNGTIATTPRQVDNSKRLWDDTAVHTIQQIQRIYLSRFLKNP